MYTTHGLMTAADLADYHDLYDTGGQAECPGHETSETGYLAGRVFCSVNEDPCPEADHNCGPGCPSPCPQDDDDPRAWQG